MQQVARISEISPNDTGNLAELAAQIVALLNQRAAITERIRAKYQEAADLGCPKAGFKLAIAHSCLAEDKRQELVRGYRSGSDALGLQLELFEE